MKRYLVIATASLIDLILLLSVTTAIFIMISGGGRLEFNTIEISAYSARNLLILLIILLPARYFLLPFHPLLGIEKLDKDNLQNRSFSLCRNLHHYLSTIDEGKIKKILFIIILVSFFIKVMNAWFYNGFYSGDDVEIHEMTMSILFDLNWEAWNLRNPFYPMVFIFPVQAVLSLAGFKDPAIFVFAGRLVVILFSLLNILLVFKIAKRLFHSDPIALCATCIFAFSKLHIVFSSSVLPRTVASTFLLIAFLIILTRRSAVSMISSGLLLGILLSIRFSGAIFIIPFFFHLIFEKRIKDALIVSLSSLASAAVIIGMADWLYWGKSFFSLINIIDYTLVQKISSRGYQPVYSYILLIPQWSNLFIIYFFLSGLKAEKRRLWIWVFLPLILLSILPHKEVRYLVPLIPFVAIIAGYGMWRQLSAIAEAPRLSSGHETRGKALFFLFMLAGAFFMEVDGFRFRRSEFAVDAAKYLNKQADISGIYVQQLWRTGGRIYFSRDKRIANLTAEQIDDPVCFKEMLSRSSADCLMLRDRHIQKNNYEPILKANLFREIKISNKRNEEGFRLFAKKGTFN